MTEPLPEEGVQVPLVWVGLDDVPVQTSNQALLQIAAKDEFVLVVGHTAGPVVLGSEDEQREQLKNVNFVPVRPIVRLGLTRQRVEELLHPLERQIEAYDQRFEAP